MDPFDLLTPREQQAARLAIAGKTNREIAAHFGRSEQVIKNWFRVIYDKLGVWSRLEMGIMLSTPKAPSPLYDMATGKELTLR